MKVKSAVKSRVVYLYRMPSPDMLLEWLVFGNIRMFVLTHCVMIHVYFLQTTSRRLADRKNQKFQKNVTRRGAVPETTVKKGNDYPVGPVLLGFFVFVVIGSCKLLPCSFLLLFLSLLCILLLLALFLIGWNNTLWLGDARIWHKSISLVTKTS